MAVPALEGCVLVMMFFGWKQRPCWQVGACLGPGTGRGIPSPGQHHQTAVFPAPRGNPSTTRSKRGRTDDRD